jgi:beta-lactam-binding protein with PASTA domain
MPEKKKTLWRFFLTRTFWKNVGIMFLIVTVLLIGIQLVLRNYTDHGEEIQVPNMTGLELLDADELCYQKNLKWSKQDSIHNKNLPGGVVIDQYPPAGFRVKKNRTIFFTTSRWYPEMIPMPKAYDMSYRQAKRILESQGLHIDSLEYEPYFARTYVMKQKFRDMVIEEGTPVEKGSGIVLVLGQGLSNETDLIPDLKGMSKDSAASIALDLHFNVGAIVYDESILNEEDSLTALIYKQFPESNRNKARLGSPIDIWLTLDSLKLYEVDSVRFKIDSLPEIQEEIQMN